MAKPTKRRARQTREEQDSAALRAQVRELKQQNRNLIKLVQAFDDELTRLAPVRMPTRRPAEGVTRRAIALCRLLTGD